MATKLATETPMAKPPLVSTDAAYLKIRDLIYHTSGIYQSGEKLYLLMSRCVRRMSAVGAKLPPIISTTSQPARIMRRNCVYS